MRKTTLGYTLTAAALALMLGGCESDRFASAPTVRAPSSAAAPGEASPRMEANPARSAGPLKAGANAQLPPDHPPMGGSAGAGSAGGQIPMPPAAGAMSVEQFGKVGPFRWTAPDNWLAVKPASQMRLAEYHLLGADGTEPATMSVFYFGPQGGGAIQANIDRWVEQFKAIQDGPTQATQQVSGMTVHRVAVSGTFDVGAARSGEGLREQWRMLGAIAESPSGNYFFKLTGPQATIDAHEAGFDAFVSSFQPVPPPG